MTTDSSKISAPLLAAFAVFAFAQSAQATAIEVPSTAEPGILTRSLENQIRSTSAPANMITVAPSTQESAKVSDEKIFTLENVVLENSTIYTQADLSGILQSYVGKPASFADLNAIARALTAKYRNDGYIFSRVIVPPQKVKDGTVRLSAVEGRITDVKIVGSYDDNNGLIQDFANKIKSGGPTNDADVERYMLLINDLPGITARAIMAPSQVPGGGELTINIEQKQVEAALSADNRGTRYLGPYRGTAIVAGNSLFGIHDRTTARGIASADGNELLFGELTHEEQLGTEGARIKARYSRTRSRPGNTLDDFDIKGNSDTFDLEGMYPLLRSRHTNLNLTTGFNSLGSEASVLGFKTSEDRVRSLRAGAHYDITDSWAGINLFEVAVIKGVDVFDATKDGEGRSRTNGQHDFVRSTFSATRVQDLTNNFSVQISGSGQYSADPLLASEEFTLGGTEYGRAYDSGEVTGDQGIAGSAELRYGENVDDPYMQSYQAFTYYDTGRVWNLKHVVAENSTDVLSSVGAGVRFNLAYDISGSLELDQPLTRKVSADNDKGARVFFSLLKRF